MSAFTSAWLPHLGAALVLASITLAITSRITPAQAIRRGVFAFSFLVCLLPLPEHGLSDYLRIITGDLSLTGFILLGFASGKALLGEDPRHAPAMLLPAAMIAVVALVLYPTALGLTYFDLYAYGYYPIIVGPMLLALFAVVSWYRQWLTAAILGAGFLGYALGLLESDNLWDYLLDPVVTAYAVYLVIINRHTILRFRPSQQQIELLLVSIVTSFLLFAIFLSRSNHDAFQYELVIEDGFIEWCTVIILFATMLVCLRRFMLLRTQRPPLFLAVTLLLALLCLFGAGEEISWGQRIFGIETPEYLKDRNAQGELGLHNMVVEINGEQVKLNKLIFGTGLALALLIYLFIATPLYRTNDLVRAFFNAIAAPMPRNYQIAGYLLIVATVELLIDSSKRGEMTEFAGSIMFALNVIYPYNPALFQSPRESGALL